MALSILERTLKKFNKQVREVEEYLLDRNCDGIFVTVSPDDLHFVHYDFLEAGEEATLRCVNGVLQFVIEGGERGAREWHVADLQPGIRLALEHSLEELKQHCDRVVEDARHSEATRAGLTKMREQNREKYERMWFVRSFFDSSLPTELNVKAGLASRIDGYIATCISLLGKLPMSHVSMLVNRDSIDSINPGLLFCDEFVRLYYRYGSLFLVRMSENDPEQRDILSLCDLPPEMRLLVAAMLPSLIARCKRKAMENETSSIVDVDASIESPLP